MPQLDKVTFLSQFFWLCFFYLGFYYLVLKYFLPKISRILTLRKKKMNFSHYGSPSLQQENHQVRQNLDTILFRGFSLSRKVFNDLLSRTTNWLDQSLTTGNKTHYKTGNNSYIKSIGDASLSQNIKLYQASIHSPENLKGSVIVERILNLRKAPISLSPKMKAQQNPPVKKLKNFETVTKKTSVVQENTKKSKKNKK
jgi:F-type H+-transporting ATPase subunit b